MRYLIIVKATPGGANGHRANDILLAAIDDYRGTLARAGVLLDAQGLRPGTPGWRVHYRGSRCAVEDGPFAGSAERIAGYTLIQVASREEALEWSRRFPLPATAGVDADIEVRALSEPDGFNAGMRSGPPAAPGSQVR